MAEDDVQRLVLNIEARTANIDKQLAKLAKLTDETMKGVSKNTDAAMKRMEQSSARAAKALNQAFGGLKGQLLSSVSGLNGQAGLLTNTLGNLGPAGTTAALGLGSLVAIFGLLYTKGKQAIQAADDIGDAAAKLGVSAESLQELRAVFNGLVDPAQVDAGLGKLTEQIGLASAGVPKAAKVFKALGIDIRDGSGNVKEGLPVYLELADKIAGLKSPAQQAAAAQKLLGDSGREMLPVLRQGSAAIKESIERYRALGAIIPEDVITKAGALQQQLDDLALVIKAQLTTALVAVGPQIVQLTQWLATNLPAAIQIATKVLQFLADHIKTIITLFGSLAGFQIGELIGSALGPIGAVVGALVGALTGGSATLLGFGSALDSIGGNATQAAGEMTGATRTLTAAEQTHIDTLTALRDIYAEVQTASGDRVQALKDEQAAIIDKATAEELAASQVALAKASAATDAARPMAGTAFDEMGVGLEAATAAENAAQARVDAVKKNIEELKAAASGTEHVFDPITAGLDELVANLGRLNPEQITETQAAFVSASQAVKDLVSDYNDADQQFTSTQEQYSVLLAQLADVTGWDSAGQTMKNFLQSAKDIQLQLIDGTKTTQEADAAYKHLIDMFGVPVSAAQLVGEIGKIEGALQSMSDKAKSAFATLGEKLGNYLRTFALTGAGTVVPDNAGVPRPRGTPPPVVIRPAGAELGDLGKGGGAAKKAAEPKDPKLPEYLKLLQTEIDRLALSGVALKENQLRTEALAKAKEDFKNKLRESADLTDAETAAISENAKVLAGVPDILKVATDKLPQFSLAQQLKQLTELQGLLTDPAVVQALEAQGLSAEDAGRAIRAQIAEVKAQADGTTEAITGIGDAFQSGIQGATSFADAVTKIGLALAQMLVQAAAFGNTKAGGPLGGLFDSLAGTIGGLSSLLGSSGAAGGTPLGLGGIGHRAGGGNLAAGQASWINEVGQEAARRGQDLFIPGKATTIMPADATRSAMGGASNSNSKIDVTISGARGSAEIQQAVATGMEIAYRRAVAAAPEAVRQHKVRFA